MAMDKERRETLDGLSLVVLGWPGEAGALALVRKYRKELEERYPRFWLDSCPLWREAFADEKSFLLEKEKPEDSSAENYALPHHLPITWQKILSDAEAYLPIGESGFLKALWDFGEALDMGMRVKLREIPMRQFTIEVCEMGREDPLNLASRGCFLAVTGRPRALIEKAAAAGLSGKEIGYLQKDRRRTLEYGEEVRFLQKSREKATECCEDNRFPAKNQESVPEYSEEALSGLEKQQKC